MCYALYIGTKNEQQVEKFIATKTVLCLQELGLEKEINGLRPKFSKEYIYYVGSYQGCSCGFAYDPLEPKEEDDDYEDEEAEMVLMSIKALISLIENLSKEENIELYCCWEGEWEEQIEERLELNIKDISIGKNYFGLNKNHFILFKQQVA